MAATPLARPRVYPVRQTIKRLMARLSRYWPLYLMLLPGILYFLVFRYWPIYGLVIAFKNFRVLDGITGSPWVGFQNFQALFDSPLFIRALRNTAVISFLKLVIGFPMPIILALMLNEVRHSGIKRLIQTVSYLPHFLSWVIIYAILIALLSPARGLVKPDHRQLWRPTYPILDRSILVPWRHHHFGYLEGKSVGEPSSTWQH